MRKARERQEEGGAVAPQGREEEGPGVNAPVVNHVHDAEVVRVIDGDTFVARIDLDFRVKVDVTVRVRGLWAAELHAEGGEAAKQALVDRLAQHANRVTLLSYKDTMSFARWVCDVWIGGQHLQGQQQ
jgi:endonuclease YncB( thermonuclease family)